MIPPPSCHIMHLLGPESNQSPTSSKYSVQECSIFLNPKAIQLKQNMCES